MEKKFIIMSCSDDKLEEALSLVWRTFQEFEAASYTDEGILEFKDYIKLNNIKIMLNKNLKLWIALDDDNVVGVCSSRDCSHVSLLFVDSNYHKLGIARQLLKMLEDDCIKSGFTTLTVNSSPYAIDAYKALGYRAVDSMNTVKGIDFLPMIKKI